MRSNFSGKKKKLIYQNKTMAVKVFSASPLGMDGKIIEIEVDSSSGQAVFNIVGLPDAAVKESQDRVSSAIRNSAFARHIFMDASPLI